MNLLLVSLFFISFGLSQTYCAGDQISLSHQNLNADLRKEVLFYKKKCEHFEYMYNQLKKEKEDLHSKGQSMLNEFRNKGDV